jgi:hypothetical protein
VIRAPCEIAAEAMAGADAWNRMSPGMRAIWLDAVHAGFAVFADPPPEVLDLVAKALADTGTQALMAGSVTYADLARSALLVLTMPPVKDVPPA